MVRVSFGVRVTVRIMFMVDVRVMVLQNLVPYSASSFRHCRANILMPYYIPWYTLHNLIHGEINTLKMYSPS